MIPSLFAAAGTIVASPPATFSNVKFLLPGLVLPWYDVGNIGLGVANYAAVVDTSVKPSWATGSFYTGSASNHGKGAKVANPSGTTFNLGTAFCVESMVYCHNSGTNIGARIFDARAAIGSTAWIFSIDTSMRLIFTVAGTTYGTTSPTPSATVTADTWVHCRCTYDGTTLRLFINGVIVWSAAQSLNVTTAGAPLTLGNEPGLTTNGIGLQYLSQMRIVIGQAVSTIAFIPPSAAWPDSGAVISLQTNVTYSNVKLRSNYDTTVADQSNSAHTMTAAGSAAASTPAKFGAGALLLDGTGDYVSTPDSTDFDLGTGDYQFQGWVYRNGTTANRFIISCYVDSTHGYSMQMVATSCIIEWVEQGDNTAIFSVDAIPNTTFTHVAVGRKDGVTYVFMDGVLQRLATLGKTADCNGTMFIGRLNNTFTTLDWLGSIDDIQLVKGECQLYRSFLVPTAALPTS